MAEQIVTGKKYRVLIDAASRLWQRISFWTSSVDVEMGDGHTLEQNLGAIKGITTSTSVGSTGYAADASTVSGINNKFGGLRFGQKDGQWGYYTGTGADTFNPFRSQRNVSVYSGHVDQYIESGTYYSWSWYTSLSNLGLGNKEIIGAYLNNTFCAVSAGAVAQTYTFINDGKIWIRWRDYNEQGVLGNFLSSDYYIIYYDD